MTGFGDTLVLDMGRPRQADAQPLALAEPPRR